LKEVVKFFIYLGLIAVALYTSGCLYDHKPVPGGNGENQHKGVTAPEQPAVLEQKNTDREYELNNSTNNNVQPEIKEKTSVVLYFDNGKGGLSAERREIPKVSGIARQTVYELCRGPLNHALFPTLPKNTKLLDINIKDGLCTVNFSRELITAHSGGSGAENLTVYSIVNTLTQFNSVERVQILVEGKKVETIAGHLDVSSPLERDNELISSI
jgi:spore germination protein GerM